MHGRASVVGVGARKAELVHHPVRLGAFPGAACVVNEGLLEADAATGGAYGPVDAGGLPESGSGDPVRPDAVPVLPTSQAKEVPFLLSGRAHDFCEV